MDFEVLGEECELERVLERVFEDRELERDVFEDERDEEREEDDEERDDELDERDEEELLLFAGALALGAGAGAEAFFWASRNIGLANDKVKVSASLAMRLGFVLSVMI